jgi:RimJ/RimL family protein N-acetyltransferase
MPTQQGWFSFSGLHNGDQNQKVYHGCGWPSCPPEIASIGKHGEQTLGKEKDGEGDCMNFPRLPLETKALRLRRFVEEDAPAVLAQSQEESARLWLPSQVNRDVDHALAVVTFLIEQYSSPGDPRFGPFVLAIEHRADSAFIGHVGFSPLDNEVEIGFSIAQNYHKQGLATEAVAAASRWACRTFGLTRFLGITALANIASRRTLERAGFTHEEDRAMCFQGTEQHVSFFRFCPTLDRDG